MYKLKEIKDNAVNKKLKKLLVGKRVLFLENDFGHYHADGNFEIWLMENKIQYNSIFGISSVNMEYIIEVINHFDVIAFETTWTYEISQKIKEYLMKSRSKKIIIECFIGSEPSWYYKPKGIVHDLYTIGSGDEDMDNWDFYKLRVNKPYWED